MSGYYKAFEKLVADTGGTYAFDGETSVRGIGMILEIIREMGLDPAKTEEFKKGVLSLFNVEVIRMPDMEKNRYILAPNHVSDLDAIIMGLLCPATRIISKNDWTDNTELKRFLDIHYDVYGFNRKSLQSLRELIRDSVAYFNKSDETKHLLVFSQGTISDFNNNSPERISPICQVISIKTGAPVVPVFIEQASLYHRSRIVFGEPLAMTRKSDFRTVWLEKEKEIQNSLSPPARRPVLSHKHSNNNMRGEEYF